MFIEKINSIFHVLSVSAEVAVLFITIQSELITLRRLMT